MALSRDAVRRIALLARLELTEEELDAQVEHMNALLAQFEKLQELDVTGVEPTAHTFPVYNVMREDRCRPSLPREAVLGNAPEQRDGCFVVPSILEGA